MAAEVGRPQEFLEALAAGEVRPAGKDGSAGRLVHTGFRIAGEVLRECHNLKTPLLKDLALNVPLPRNLVPGKSDAGGRLLERVPFPAVDLLGSLGDLIDSHLYIAPYVAVQGYFGRERQKARALRRDLYPGERNNPKIGVFLDGTDAVRNLDATYRGLWAAAGVALSVPVVGAYHTEFGDYARAFSGDAFAAEIVDAAARQFYERCSAVAVPSQATALALRNRGYRVERYEVLKGGVDIGLFSPARRDAGLREFLGGGRHLLLYAGRVGKEEGLDLLAEGYRELRRRRGRDDVHLVVAGDGPYRGELEARLGGTVTFTGALEGAALARTLASCAVFLCPAPDDTSGPAVVEAQASGLPAVVFGSGGAGEPVSPGVDGFVVAPGDEASFIDRVEELLVPKVRDRMGRAARGRVADLSWESALERLDALHARVSKLDAGRPDEARPDRVSRTA